MNFVATVDSDVGTVKTTNQDAACIKIAETAYGQVAMAIVCDGMGGLEKGELASATVINEFNEWFCNELPRNIDGFNWGYVSEKWIHIIKKLNRAIGDFGRNNNIRLGTTVTAMLLFKNEYLIAHVGDSRVYQIDSGLLQLTEDHSVVGREVRQGLISEEDAEKDPRRNVLLQCVGASNAVEPQIVRGQITGNTSYLLCSDGFRHVISRYEIFEAANPQKVKTSDEMKSNLRRLIDTAKYRGEQDNISALLINARA